MTETSSLDGTGVTLVLDASAIIDLLLGRPFTSDVARLVGEESVALHAPDLIWAEATSVLRRLCLSGDCSEHRAHEALTDLVDLGLITHPMADLAPSALQLRNQVSAYDAMYISLAMALPGTLVTADHRLARAVEPLCSVLLTSPSPTE